MEPKYKLGIENRKPMLDQGKHWVVVGPGGTILGSYATEEEAQQKADSLNQQSN